MHRNVLVVGVAGLLAAIVPAQTSKNCQLLAKRSHSGSNSYAGVWGYVHTDGSEYACVGANNGTWILETTDPANPVERGFISGPSGFNGLWREINGYGQYIYTVTEAGGGVQVISMANPRAPVLVRTVTRTGWSNTHTVSVDQTAAKLYCNGTGQGMLIFDLSADPSNPTYITTWSGVYAHDSFAQHGYCYVSAINNGQLRILNVANLPTITQLGQVTTPGGVTHNCWANSTDTIALTTDENSTGFLQVWDVSNKALPVKLGKYSIAGQDVHNAFLVDDKVAHMAYYTAGYRAVDVTDPNAPREIGYYDATGMDSWGCYPFQPSGTVYVTDYSGSPGVSMLRLTCGVPQRYGTGTAGSNGRTPKIDWNGGYARVNNATFRLEVKNALENAPAVLLLGGAQTSASILGITLLVDLTPPTLLLNAITSANGAASMTLGIPNDPTLANQSLYGQWIVVDAAGPQGFAATQGSKITICPNN